MAVAALGGVVASGFAAPSASAADACANLSFQTTGPASRAYSVCAAADINGTFAAGQSAQFSYSAPAGYTITSVLLYPDPDAYYGGAFKTYVVIDGHEQRFRDEEIPNLHASSVSLGIRCEPDPDDADRGCNGDYFALKMFSVDLEKIPVPVSAENPEPCNRARAQAAGIEFLEPYAVRTYPRYWRDVASGEWLSEGIWRLGNVYCRDLTGDGSAEMIAMWRGGTGGSIQPWAIFKRDATGHWHMAYAQVRDTTDRMAFRGRTIITPKVAVYEGAFTNKYRKRYVRWNGRRFVSRVGAVYKIHNPNRA